MLRKPITYTTFDGETVTEDFYFNLTKAELIELELSTPGGFTEHLTQIAQSNDGKAIIEKFKEIIKMAYGVRSEDGKRFIKKPELFEEFTQTEAYSVLFMELATEANKSAEFINGLVPQDLARQAHEVTQNASVQAPTTQTPEAAVQNPARRMPQDRLPKQRKDQYRTEQLPQPEVTEGSNSSTDETALPAEPVTQEAAEPKTHYTLEELAALPGDQLRRLQEQGLDSDPDGGFTVRPPHESGQGFSQA